ncbi:MAG: sigma factor [Actinomycetota bacterium]
MDRPLFDESPEPEPVVVPPTDIGVFLAELHGPLIRALTVRTGDRAVAEDLAQEAIMRTWLDWDRVAAMENPRGWVYRIGFNLAASQWRRRLVRRRVEQRLDRERSAQ